MPLVCVCQAACGNHPMGEKCGKDASKAIMASWSQVSEPVCDACGGYFDEAPDYIVTPLTIE